MKNPKRLTLEQKRAVSAAGLIAKNWMLVEQTEFYLKIIHKSSRIIRRIDRYAIPRKEKEDERMQNHSRVCH